MLALLTAFLCVQDAEKKFKEFEKKFLDAGSLSFRVTCRTSGIEEKDSTISGTVKIRKGNRYFFDLTAETAKGKESFTSRSDGKKVVNKEGGTPSESPTQENTTEFMTAGFTRLGFVPALLLTAQSDARLPTADELAKPSDFATDGKSITYTLDFGKESAKVEIWLDADLHPTKRVVKVNLRGKDATFVETYEQVSTKEIPDADFEHK